jgi:hypothetical protein
MRKSHLVYPSQPLIIRMRNNLENQGVIDGDKAMNRVVDDFANALPHVLLSVLLKLSGQMYKGRGDKKDLLL